MSGADIDFEPSDYSVMRQTFLDLGSAAQARHTTFAHPFPGPDGEALATDVLLTGDTESRNLLIVTSGVHGVEGPAGSMIQASLLGTGRPAGSAALLLVHAVNPFGFAWMRRVNECNVDVNRNFVDFHRCPVNEGYREIHRALMPQLWDQRSVADCRDCLMGIASSKGFKTLQGLFSDGQHEFSDGLFYGGSRSSWSRSTVTEIMANLPPHVERIGLVDLHTGLGSYGQMEVMLQSGTEAAKAFESGEASGQITTLSDGSSSSTAVTGSLRSHFRRCEATRCVLDMTLEFGTFDAISMAEVLIAENWHHHNDRGSKQHGRSTQALRDSFSPPDRHWRAMVIEAGVRTIHKAVESLVSS